MKISSRYWLTMKKNFWFFGGILTASMLSAADPVENLYPNHEFQSIVKKDGTIELKRHWCEGKILELGKMNDKTAIKFQSVSVKYGGFNAVMAGPKHGLTPGKYCFSVWCKIDPGENLDDVVFFRLINHYTPSTGKTVNIQKKYSGPDKPVPGKWVELTGIFEIPKDDIKNAYLMFGHYGKSPVSVWYAAPSIERSVEK